MDEHRIIRELHPHVIIGTPGRILDHIDKRNFLTEYVETLVIDEFDKCLELVHAELAQMRDKQLSDKALRVAKRQLIGQLAVASDNGEAQALSMAKSMLVFGEVMPDEEVRRRIEAITPDSLQRVARQVLSEDRLCTLIFK